MSDSVDQKDYWTVIYIIMVQGLILTFYNSFYLCYLSLNFFWSFDNFYIFLNYFLIFLIIEESGVLQQDLDRVSHLIRELESPPRSSSSTGGLHDPEGRRKKGLRGFGAGVLNGFFSLFFICSSI